jgi:hypothetical protein
VAARQPPGGESEALEKTVARQRLLGVRRAARHVAAIRSQQRRNALPVGAQE